MTAADLVPTTTNPTEGDLHANGKGVNLGISPDCMVDVLVTDGISSETLRPHLLASNYEALNSHITNPQHVEVIGPDSTKGYVEGKG